VAQPWPALENGFEHHWRGVAVLNIGAVHDKSNQETARVGDDVALAAFDLFSGVKAPNSAAFRGFYALILSLPKDGCRSRPPKGWLRGPLFRALPSPKCCSSPARARSRAIDRNNTEPW
jgi:hypothetical protein